MNLTKMKNTMLFLLLLISNLLTFEVDATPTNLSKVVAIVDDMPITEYEAYQTYLIMRTMGQTQESYQSLHNEIIEDLINKMVITNSAKEYNIDISNVDVDTKIEEIAKSFGGTKATFPRFLKSIGIDYDYFIKYLKSHLIWSEIIQGEMKKISDQNVKVKEIYKSIPSVQQILKQEEKKHFHNQATSYEIKDDTKFEIAEMIISKACRQKDIHKISKLAYDNVSFKKIKSQFPSCVELSSDSGSIGWVKFREMSEIYRSSIEYIIKNVEHTNLALPLENDKNIILIKMLDLDRKSIELISNPDADKALSKIPYEERIDILARAGLAGQQEEIVKIALINKLRKKSFIKIT